jgi:RNA-splicing ligase RtcB
MSLDLLNTFRASPFLGDARTLLAAQEQMGTQGDGNHFLFVGRSRATGRTALITHHGSRGVGGFLYKHGLAVAERVRREISPETLPQNAWIPVDSDEGRDYRDALQLVRR